MARITKNPEERRAELIDTAEELFKTVGYEKTAVSDIVKKIGVAQGTFYYYFKSKEEIFQAIFHRHTEKDVSELRKIMENPRLGVIDKYNQMWLYQFKAINQKSTLTSQLHIEENIGLHQRVNVERVQEFSKVYTELIEQGIKEGVVHTQYPYEAAEFLMLITNFLFDPGVFHLTKQEYIRKVQALDEFTRKIFDYRGEMQDKATTIKEAALSMIDHVKE